MSLTYLSSSFRHSGAQASANATPAVILESRAGGGIHLGGLIANPTGTVRILFTGENPGALTSIGAMSTSSGLTNVAPIWAHALTISGASSVGTASKPILAFLFGLGDEDPSVSAVATGDMHMELTPAELKMVASIPNSPDTTALKYRLRLVQALTDGVNAIRLGEGLRIYQKAGTSVVAMPQPGTLLYLVDALVGLSGNVELSNRDALNHYSTATIR